MNTKKMNTLNTVGNSKTFFDKIKYELFVFIVLLAEMLLYMPHDIESLSECSYVYYITNYSNMGFTSRMLLGSIIDLFTDFYSGKLTFTIAFCVMISVIALMSIFIGGAIKKSGDGALILLFVFCLFILLPTSTEQFLGSNFGTVELYHLFLTLIALFFMQNKILRWTVPLVFTVCNAMHCSYVFIYMSSVAIALFYNCSRTVQSDNSLEKIKINKSGIVLCSVAFVFLVSSFIVFGMFESKNPLIYENPEQMRQALSKTTDLEITDHLMIDHFRADMDTKDNNEFEETMVKKGISVWLTRIVPSLLLNISTMFKSYMLPLLLFLIANSAVWIESYRKEQDNFKKFTWAICLLSPIISLPVFIFNDWEKYIGGMCISQLLLLCYFTKNEASVKTALAKLKDKALNNPAVMLSIFTLAVMLRVIWGR